MPTEIATTDGGTLLLSEQGEIVFEAEGSETETVSPQDAIRRWPNAAAQILQALSNLEIARETGRSTG